MKKIITAFVFTIIVCPVVLFGQNRSINSDKVNNEYLNDRLKEKETLINHKLFDSIKKKPKHYGFETLKLDVKYLKGHKVKANTNDSLALVTLYNSTGGDNWVVNENWLNGPVSTWSDVILDTLGRVVQLSLGNNSLVGELPSEIGNLSSLEYLYLSDNDLTGTIPSEIGMLSNLIYLSLTRNSISGNIPSEILNLSSLSILALGDNLLSGSIPTQIGELSSLTELYLWGNELTGEIPNELGLLTNLVSLQLSQNQLTGVIPGALSNLSKLEILYLWDNQLTGRILPSLARLTSLMELSLSFNSFTGAIPRELGVLTNLEILNLNNNLLSGSIPTELGNLNSLRSLYLYWNNLSGTIPTELGNLALLERLYLYQNNLSGTIPSQLGNLSSLEILYLDENSLSGSIPSELGDLSSLKYLDLFENQLSGELPEELKNLSELVHLRLFGNQFSGAIPRWLPELSSITYISLGSNQFTGVIPTEFNELSENENFRYLYLYDNLLSGNVPNKIWELDLFGLRLDGNEFIGEIPSTLKNMNRLSFLYLDGNKFTSLPDLSELPRLESLHIDSLKLTFKDILPNIGLASDTMSYAPQFDFGDTTGVQATIGSSVTFGVESIEYEGNQYQWHKDGFALTGETDITLTLSNVSDNNYGEYVVEVTNSALSDLVVKSEPFYVSADGTIPTSNEDILNEALPGKFTLSQNYPNPFNPSSTIEFGLPEVAEVQLEVFNMLGQRVSTLINRTKMQAGWHSIDFDAANLSSGMYIYRIQAGNFIQTKKMMLIK